MTLLLTALAALVVAGEVDFVESRLTVDGRLVSYETPDIDADGRGRAHGSTARVPSTSTRSNTPSTR